MFADVVIFGKIGFSDDVFTYSIPEEMVSVCEVGCFVNVTFRSIQFRGIVIGISDGLPVRLNKSKIKPITKVLTSSDFLSHQLELAFFVSRYYRTSLKRAVNLFFPKFFLKGSFFAPEYKSYSIISEDTKLKGSRQKAVLDAIFENGGEMTDEELKSVVAGRLPAVRSLVKNGIIKESIRQTYEPFDHMAFTFRDFDKELTKEQSDALFRISSTVKPILLHGVTGSGKTEIFLRQIVDTINKGKQVIFLVPEIGLTPQTVKYFRDHLTGHIAVFHSKLSESEREREWWKVKTGFAPLIIGSRSAIFAPADNIGLIIIDEEHEWTYKQENTPHYMTHRVAAELCGIYGAKLILGSATPSAESYYRGESGEYEYIFLSQRFHNKPMPLIHVADMREEFKKKNFSIFSNILRNKIADRLLKREQVMLFLNQRGMASAVVCRDCGFSIRCDKCAVSMKYHSISSYKSGITNSYLMCHYCGTVRDVPLVCPECSSPYIKYVGIGTQRVEDEASKLFPGARVVRADADTTADKAGFGRIHREFMNGKYDILVGTQMIAKGHDFPNVTLTGIVLADTGLHIPDFRSSERLFQTLTQVAGRCGRGDGVGEVVLQTYDPEHLTIKSVAEYDYKGFMRQELRFREKLFYPPFNRMVKFTVIGQDKKKIAESIRSEEAIIEDISKANRLDIKIISAPALISKIQDRYYYHLIIRSSEPAELFRYWKPPVGWRVDVDPLNTI